MTDTLAVATLGAGFFSQFHRDAWDRLQGARLVALCDCNAKRAEEAAARHADVAMFTDLDTMLATAKPDLLDIITPPPTHLDAIRCAAEHGVATICQKPFCADLDTARRAADIADAAGILLVVHENFRFQPWYRAMKTAIDDGVLGEVYQATFRLRPGDGQGPDAYLARQPYFQKMPRFLVHETAIHFIDVFRYLLGEMTSVQALLSQLNPAIAGEDAGLITFEHDGGARSLFDGNRLADHAAENRRLTMGEMVVEGSKGTLALDGAGRVLIRPFGENTARPLDFSWKDRGFGGDCVYRLQAHVVGHLRTGAPIENQASDYLRNIEVEDAIYRAHDEGRRISL